MTNVTEMSAPVTRGELREELGQLTQTLVSRIEAGEQRLDKRIDDVERRLVGLEGMEVRLGKEINEAEKRLGQFLSDMENRLGDRLSAQLAKHAQAHHDDLMSMLSKFEEKYADLPGRVTRLEGAVFPSEQR